MLNSSMSAPPSGRSNSDGNKGGCHVTKKEWQSHHMEELWEGGWMRHIQTFTQEIGPVLCATTSQC